MLRIIGCIAMLAILCCAGGEIVEDDVANGMVD